MTVALLSVLGALLHPALIITPVPALPPAPAPALPPPLVPAAPLAPPRPPAEAPPPPLVAPALLVPPPPLPPLVGALPPVLVPPLLVPPALVPPLLTPAVLVPPVAFVGLPLSAPLQPKLSATLSPNVAIAGPAKPGPPQLERNNRVKRDKTDGSIWDPTLVRATGLCTNLDHQVPAARFLERRILLADRERKKRQTRAEYRCGTGVC